MNKLRNLSRAVRAIAPIDGVSIGRWDDNSTWRVDYTPEATPEQIAAVEQFIAAYDPDAPTVDDVITERSRRLALGFDYGFSDSRGTHHIGTTPQDMIGWDEVTKLATALINAGDTTSTIGIVTDTGPTQVTAPEWNAILIAAGQFRQPIWHASFVLQKMNPIPADYTDDIYWPDGEKITITPASMASVVPHYTVADLPAGSLGQMAFATDGRKSGEDEGQGTGVLVFHDGSGWKTSDTGAAVSA